MRVLYTGHAGLGLRPRGAQSERGRTRYSGGDERQPLPLHRVRWDHPREQVWEMFGRVRDVAACLPGTSLIGEPTPEHVEGQIQVKIGPITAEFRGQAEIERDESSYSGKISGAGSAIRSNSATRGMISYHLVPGPDGQSTEVVVTIGYTLTGMLAQFGRPSIVQDVAARMTAAFANNL